MFQRTETNVHLVDLTCFGTKPTNVTQLVTGKSACGSAMGHLITRTVDLASAFLPVLIVVAMSQRI